jgi:hypothetical protein
MGYVSFLVVYMGYTHALYCIEHTLIHLHITSICLHMLNAQDSSIVLYQPQEQGRLRLPKAINGGQYRAKPEASSPRRQPKY